MVGAVDRFVGRDRRRNCTLWICGSAFLGGRSLLPISRPTVDAAGSRDDRLLDLAARSHRDVVAVVHGREFDSVVAIFVPDGSSKRKFRSDGDSNLDAELAGGESASRRRGRLRENP